MMRTQENWFKVALMTLAAVALMIGTFTFSASAQNSTSGQTGYPPEKQKDGDYKRIVILYNQFEAGKYVKVDGLELLCVPTHKDIYEDGKQTDGQKDDGKPKAPPEQKFDHLACYKVFDHYNDDKQY
jgi:hypothetical protein